MDDPHADTGLGVEESVSLAVFSFAGDNDGSFSNGDRIKWVFDSILATYELRTEDPIDGEVVFARHLLTSEVESLKQKFEDT